MFDVPLTEEDLPTHHEGMLRARRNRLMQQVFFNIKPDVSKQQAETVLSRIRSWDAVESAVPLLPDADVPEIARMCFAAVKETADPQTVLEELSRLTEVEAVSLPPERDLL